LSDVTIQITEYCLELISKQANSALDEAPDFLTLLADQTGLPEERTMYLDAMHELNFARKKVFATISDKLRKPFDVLIHGEIPPEFARSGGVIKNVTGATELEEKLALETMLNKSRAKSEIQLQNVARSLNTLMGNDWVKRHYNPMDPEYIIRAWVAGVQEMQLHPKGNLGLYGVLDSLLLNKLPAVYEAIGRYIEGVIERGVTPSPRASTMDSQSTVTDETDFESMFGDIDAASPEMGLDYTGTSAVSSDQPDTEERTAELVEVISRLQKDRSLDDSEYYASNYQMDLRRLLEDQKITPDGAINPWTIGQVNDDVIDMTSLMFGFIMDDYNLPDDIRFHISRLQLPYLKLGLLDKSLFQIKDHPGRQLLMDLSQAINTWDPGHSSGLDKLITEMIRVIDSILESFDTNTKIFVLTQQQFRSFLEGDEHIDAGLQERKEKRDTQFKRADNARLHIEATLADMCNKKRIPPIVEKILDEYWSKVLFLEYLKEGDEGQDYLDLLETAQILVDSVQPKANEDERKSMAKILPIIIKRLKAGLNTISVASFESVDLFRELQHCHMEVLRERPENQPAHDFEVSDEDFEAFQEQQTSVDIPWDRQAIEASMLEENIERSITLSVTDTSHFEDNPNIIRQTTKPEITEAAVTKAERERQIIDDELREAREAYELALQEHQAKKKAEAEQQGETVEEDDFMAMFFQDPDFEKKQSDALKNKDPSDNRSATPDSSAGGDEMDAFGSDLDQDAFSAMDSDDAPLTSDEVDFLEQEMVRNHSKPIQSASTEQNTNAAAPAPSEPKSTVVAEPAATVSESVDSPVDVAAGRAKGAIEQSTHRLRDDKVEELIERLKVGLWVDLYHADGSRVRAKIMAIVPTVGKYIFGDRAGKKLADYNRDGLYEAIKTGRIRLSEVDTAYDKTLESVIANLRVMKKAEDD
jgi:hypothetical protein